MSDPQDRNLVRRCIAMEEDGWREFRARYDPLVNDTARILLKSYGSDSSPGQVEEIVSLLQEKLIENDAEALRRFRWESSLSTWLVAVTRSICALWVRGEVRERKRRIASLKEIELPTPEQLLRRKEALECLQRALSELEPEDRAVAERIYADGASYDDVARETGIPRGTLATRMSRVKRFLTDRLKDFLPAILF